MIEQRIPIAPAAGHKPTWEYLVALEPELLDIEQQARAADPTDNPLGPPYVALRRQVMRLVGWEARRSELATEAAYRVAIRRISDALEDTP